VDTLLRVLRGEVSAVFDAGVTRRDSAPRHLKRIARECQAQADNDVLHVSRSLRDAQRGKGGGRDSPGGLAASRATA